MSDARSSLAVKIINEDSNAYQSLIAPHDTRVRARELLDGVRPEQLLIAPVKSPVAAHAMLAALWLWHDGLEECHKIVQKSPEDLGAIHSHASQDMTPTLSFWHAIMHRREGDFSNSKYWYARAGAHPAIALLANQAGAIVNQMPADREIFQIVAKGWNAAAFVDLVEAVHGKPTDPRHRAAISLQQLEWRVLFDFCARQAVG
jgi:hypothetical protein